MGKILDIFNILAKQPIYNEYVGLDAMFKKTDYGAYEYDTESKEFNSICLKSSYDVIYRQRENCGIEVKGSQEQISKLKLTITGKVLYLEQTDQNLPFDFFKGLKVYVYSINIKELTVMGSGNIKVDEHINNNSYVEIKIFGSGNIYVISCMCDTALISINGSGNVSFDRIIAKEKINIQINGSGNCKLLSVQTHKLENKIGGSGNIVLKHVNTENTINYILGSGYIDITGNVSHWTNHKKGSGSININ